MILIDLKKIFDKTYKENFNIMFNVALKMLNNSNNASDIVQEVFVYFYETIKAGKIINYPKSWLYRTTVNKCIDFINGNKKFESINSDFAYQTNESVEQNPEIIQQALLKLSPKERSLIVLYSEGLSYKELAEATGIKYTSVGTTISRILKKMKNELTKNKML